MQRDARSPWSTDVQGGLHDLPTLLFLLSSGERAVTWCPFERPSRSNEARVSACRDAGCAANERVTTRDQPAPAVRTRHPASYGDVEQSPTGTSTIVHSLRPGILYPWPTYLHNLPRFDPTQLTHAHVGHKHQCMPQQQHHLRSASRPATRRPRTRLRGLRQRNIMSVATRAAHLHRRWLRC